MYVLNDMCMYVCMYEQTVIRNDARRCVKEVKCGKTAPKLMCASMGMQQKELKLRWKSDDIDRRS